MYTRRAGPAKWNWGFPGSYTISIKTRPRRILPDGPLRWEPHVGNLGREMRLGFRDFESLCTLKISGSTRSRKTDTVQGLMLDIGCPCPLSTSMTARCTVFARKIKLEYHGTRFNTIYEIEPLSFESFTCARYKFNEGCHLARCSISDVDCLGALGYNQVYTTKLKSTQSV